MQTPKLPVELLNDIRDFSKMKEKIIKVFDTVNTVNETDKYDLILGSIETYYDDLDYIIRYDCYYTKYGFDSGIGIGIDIDTDIEHKLFILKSIKNSLSIINYKRIFLQKKNVNTNILHLKKLFNRSLGCLTPGERQEYFDGYI